MHALRKYMQAGLDARAWHQADLMRASGLTRQRVSQMLSDPRDVLPSVPRRETLQAIARAFQVSESTVTAVAFEAMGYDLDAVRSETDLSTATDEQLVRPPADRPGVDLDRKDGDRHGQQSAPIDKDDDPGGVVAQLRDMEAEARQRAADRDARLPADLAARRTGRKGSSSSCVSSKTRTPATSRG